MSIDCKLLEARMLDDKHTIDEENNLPSRAPSRCNSGSRMMMTKSGSRSHVYPHAPSPLHFTQLYYPKATVFSPSPTTHIKPRHLARSVKCCCCTLFTVLCSLLVTVDALAGLTLFIAWLVLRPISAPRYSVDKVEFKSFRFATPSNTVSADFDYTITASNPSRKLGFRCDRVEFETSFHDYVFGRSAVQRFYQEHQNATILTSGFVVEDFAFASERFGSELAAEVSSGAVAFHLRGSAKVRVKVGVITSMAVKILVDCDFVVKLTSPNSVTNKTCTLTR